MAGYSWKTRTFWLSVWGLAAVLIVAVAGCGGSDSSSAAGDSAITVQTGPLSKAAFIKKADAICKDLGEQFKAEYLAYTTKHEKQFWVHRKAAISGLSRTVFAPNYEERIKKIAALGAPPSDKGEIETFVRSLEDSLDTMREQPVKTSESLNTVFSKPFRAEQRYGLQGCIGGAF